LAPAAEPRSRLGIVTASFSLRGSERGKGSIADPLAFIEHCDGFGAGGVQVGIGAPDTAYLAKLRAKLNQYGMFLEGSIRLPRDRDDVARFRAEVQAAREAGARVLRTVTLGGRRYETFTTVVAFRQWTERATQSLQWAEPVLAKHEMRLAVENHKDWRAEEQVKLLRAYPNNPMRP
jgi:sugar phosphate isomerase/epimerase